ncbi:MAG: maleylpyruvate isomerase family mycothiol-dependent enzyme [Acidimicrobiales bacterium]
MSDAAAPTADMSGARAAHQALLRSARKLRDADIARPSLLPDWTVGHVLTHLARNADGHCNMFDGAARGEVFDQYPGGRAQRAGEIEMGARRRATEIVDDLESTIAKLEAHWDRTTDAVWATGRCRSFQGEMALAIQPFRRWREVEIHHHDAGTKFTWRDWSEAYTRRELEATIGSLAPRLDGQALALRSTDSEHVWTVPENSCTVVEVRAPRRQLLAWLTGRYDEPLYPKLGPWL